MLKRTIILLSIIFLISGLGWAASAEDYNFISAETLNNRINSESSMIIIDICPVEQFANGHIKGSIETNAYPVKTKAEKARLAERLPKIKASTDDVVIVCPRGGGGAKKKNKEFRESMIDIAETVERCLQDVLFDPQTSGGFLISVSGHETNELVATLKKVGIDDAAEIGEILSAPEEKIWVL